LEEALAVLEQILELEPGHPEARALQGLIRLQQGHLADAIATFQQLTEEGVQAPALYYNLAYALMLDSRSDEAEPVAAQAARDLATLPAAGPLYMKALHFQGKVREAIAFAEQALDSHPEHLPLYGSLATLYLDNEDLPMAEQVAERVLELAPEDPDAATVLGMLALSRQDAATALPYLQRAVESKPNSGRARAGQGLAAMLQGDLAAAEASLQQAVTEMPNHIGTWHVLAWCRIFMQQPQQAKVALLRALELDRNFADTHGGLAIVAIMEGQLEEAQAASKRALSLNPRSFSGLYAQSLLLQSAGQSQQARTIMDRLMKTAILPDGTTLQQAVAKAAARY
jgi:tetratricopeptide (TPR) repeat protein